MHKSWELYASLQKFWWTFIDQYLFVFIYYITKKMSFYYFHRKIYIAKEHRIKSCEKKIYWKMNVEKSYHVQLMYDFFFELYVV